ncbi:MAG: hypothetical protein ACLR8Y_02470 [Alistipes indistinctus]
MRFLLSTCPSEQVEDRVGSAARRESGTRYVTEGGFRRGAEMKPEAGRGDQGCDEGADQENGHVASHGACSSPDVRKTDDKWPL